MSRLESAAMATRGRKPSFDSSAGQAAHGSCIVRAMQAYRGKPLSIRGGANTVPCGVDSGGNWVAMETPGRKPEVIKLAAVERRCWRDGSGRVARRALRGPVDLLRAEQPGVRAVCARARAHSRRRFWRRGAAMATHLCFSPGSSWLATLIDCERRVRSSGESFESIQDDYADDCVVLNWARLHVHELSSFVLRSVDVGVEITRSTSIDVVAEWSTYGALQFPNDDVVVLTMPWGKQLSARLPAEAPITSRG